MNKFHSIFVRQYSYLSSQDIYVQTNIDLGYWYDRNRMAFTI